MEFRYNNANPAAKPNKAINTPCYANNTTNAISISNNCGNLVSKYNSGRQDHRTNQQNSTPYNLPESAAQPKISTPMRRDSQSSYGYKDYVDTRSHLEYASVWQQKQPHQQQHQQQYNQQLPWTSIGGNRSYPDNVSQVTCSNRTQTFPNSRPFYMQFNPYITQRALIASHNQQQHSVEMNDPQATNLRFGDYDYTLR
ncbi:hypothetical protein FF38_01022 [Lucilia cuprina]|uniref:Uncharacterized protein n=1 Tax=Lucilia cuprina TaxID=7375 RepID=A0A0L0CHC7_LUCCU|nr:hypothetical protein FF38_01022 [Lucilia cuprina]